MAEADRSRVLRAKYADYCSAQLTEVVMSLSDEQMYELVEEAAREREIEASNLGFTERVRLATQHLRDSVPLPDFETWRAEYEADPARYDRYLLGLWKQVAADDNGLDEGERE